MTDESVHKTPRRATLTAGTIVVALAGMLVGSVYHVEGWLASQKLLLSLMMPIGLAWLICLFMAIRAFCRSDVGTGLLFLLGFLGVSIFFSPIVNGRLLRHLESTIPVVRPLDEDAPRYRAVVVLGGGTSLSHDGRPQFARDGQRLATAAQMWYANKVDAIICTGEDHFIPGHSPQDAKADDKIDLWHPARQGIDLLLSLGVPRERLFRIPGVNTVAEMDSLKSFLQSPPETFPEQGSIALVTSAFHMPRAMRLAQTRGLDLVPIPVGYHTTVAEPTAITDLVPSGDAGGAFIIVAREYLARLMGR